MENKRVFGFLILLILIALMLLSAIPLVRMRQNARLDQCEARLQILARAMMNYRDLYSAWPPVYTTDKNGKPLHSWRALLLPFLGEMDLYEKIDFNEPWDSEKNSLLYERTMIPFCCPCEKNPEKGFCSYSVVMGDNTLFPSPSANSRNAGSEKKGMSDLILIVERPDPVLWMDPSRELTLDEIRSSSAFPIGSRNHSGALAVFADGSVRRISPKIDRNLLLEFFQISSSFSNCERQNGDPN
ncbi:MAG: DUF1559 domain-containing protein [Planctomycetia bacterium]|nr:DUF1559 domain-containing protein [Planctomycetia bacterium]